jgi:KWG Leptospira.
VLPFERGRSWVKLNGKWGLIDDKGKELTPIKYDGAIISDEGIIWVREEGKWVIIDENGKELYSNRYDYDAVTPFTEGVSWVLKGNKWGLVNKNGKEIISPKYEGVCPFVGGFSAVMVGEKWGIIDKSGKEIIPIKYDGIGVYKPQGNNYPFKDIPCDDLEDLVREGLIAIKVGDKYGFVDKSGKVVISPKYDAVIPFVGGIAAVKRDGKWGFVDKTGKEIVPPTYEYPVIDYDYLKLGYLPVVEKAGKYSTPFGGEYDFLVHVDSNLFLAKKGDKWGLIDKKNREVLSFKYDDLSHLHKDLFVYSERGKYGVISLKRGVIVQPRYDKIFYAGEGIIGLVLNNKVGFMDTLGKIIFNQSMIL